MASNCDVLYPDAPRRRVKNLGWLLAHLSEVTQLTVVPLPSGGATFMAHLTDDRHFVCQFSSRAVLRGWINRRRTWRGLPVMWRTDGHVHQLAVPIPETFGA
jgi:hypothetical protein